MNAFCAGHRARSSAAGAAQFAPVACAGPLLVNEFEILPCVFENPCPLQMQTGWKKRFS